MTAPLHPDTTPATAADAAVRDQKVAKYREKTNALTRQARERLGHDRAALVHHMALQVVADETLRCECVYHLAQHAVAIAAEALVQLAEGTS
jgi:hypothetical protein